MKTERNRGILARKAVALVLVLGFVFALSSAVYANQFTLDEMTRWGTDETIISISVDTEPIGIYRDVQIRGYGDDEWEHITPIFTVQMGTTLTTDVNLDFGADRQFDTNIIIGIRPSTAVSETTRILEFAIVDEQFIGSENVATYTLNNVGEFEFVISEWSDRGKGAIYFARIIVVDGATAPLTEIVTPTPTPPTPEEPAPPIPPAPTVTPTATPDNISVTIDGVPVVFPDQPPVVVDGRTLVPVRGVFEALGFNVGWNNEHQSATLSNIDYMVIIAIDSPFFSVFPEATGGVEMHDLDVPAQIINDRTMLPIRAVLESVGYSVDWDATTSTVVITS